MTEPKENAPQRAKREGNERRAKLLEYITIHGSVEKAAVDLGVSVETVDRWRKRYPTFSQQVARALAASTVVAVRGHNERQLPFAQFRKKYFGVDTPWFQADMIDRMENADPGTVTLILLHPEAGKTSSVEDWITYKLATDRSLRFLFGTSDGRKSEKRVQRIQRLISEDSPYQEFVDEFGPFKPDKTSESGYQPWTKQFFNIRGKELSAERDYTLESVGIMEEIAGARCDYLILDDVQSLPSLGRTDKMLDKIRQDWLTRPGSLGRTFIIGTRVGPLDIYQALQDEGLVDHVVSYPAIIEGYDLWPRPTNKTDECLPPRDVKFLWPERYSPKNYLTMRINAGEIAWERNYMQRGADSASAPFTDEMLIKSQDPVRSVNTKTADVKKANPSIERLVCTLDPGFGTNACMVAGFHPDGMWVLDGRIDKGLSTNGQIAQVVNELCAKWHMDGMQVTELVIEDKAFQRGLLKDDSFRDLAVKYGFQIRPYSTGSEKNDPDIGVPSMSAAFDQGRIMFPGADDPATNQFMKHIVSQFTKWRPGIRGNRLTQDYVMTTWFAFLRWRKLRAQLDALGPNPDRSPQGAAGFRTVALPYGMTPVLLLDGSMR